MTDERGRPVPAGGLLARWLTRVAPARASGAVGIALVSDARVRALNREYLGHDDPTDVLSFPAIDSPGSQPPPPGSRTSGHGSGSPQRRRPVAGTPRASRLRLRTNQAGFGEARQSARGAAAAQPRSRSRHTSSGPAAGVYLGDIVIARGVTRRQARAMGHDEPTELRVLALHGLLHLLGYDHERDRGTMARIERRLRRKGGLPEGLLDRTAAPRAAVPPFGPSPVRPAQGRPEQGRGTAIAGSSRARSRKGKLSVVPSEVEGRPPQARPARRRGAAAR